MGYIAHIAYPVRPQYSNSHACHIQEDQGYNHIPHFQTDPQCSGVGNTQGEYRERLKWQSCR